MAGTKMQYYHILSFKSEQLQAFLIITYTQKFPETFKKLNSERNLNDTSLHNCKHFKNSHGL